MFLLNTHVTKGRMRCNTIGFQTPIATNGTNLARRSGVKLALKFGYLCVFCQHSFFGVEQGGTCLVCTFLQFEQLGLEHGSIDRRVEFFDLLKYL